MDKITLQKIEQVNTILKEANISMVFNFSCIDLQKYKPQLTFINTSTPTKQNVSLGVHVDKNDIVKFYFKKRPRVPTAECYEDYIENLKRMKAYDDIINKLNSLQIKVPIY